MASRHQPFIDAGSTAIHLDARLISGHFNRQRSLTAAGIIHQPYLAIEIPPVSGDRTSTSPNSLVNTKLQTL
jgi:hypothetical protein